ncbi:O-antigen ligase family protein [Curtobacterium sp. 'Ferrero']|uniref:O-antigen ligase family protein n=1 Tax=Curtobacterium sp. 'Ferrero' TaxID=2033654 RepID=UPI001143B7BD|nr:O-antigen ligase family protein [Curtobacterium sp. 'Ferrero']
MHVFTILVLLAFLMLWSRRRLSSSATLLGFALLSCIALVDLSLLWPNDAVNPLLAVQFALLGLSALVLALAAGPMQVKWVYRGVLFGASASSLAAVLQQFRIVKSELWLDSSGLARPTGLVGEPDWAGFFAACAILLLIRGVMRKGSLWWLLLAVNSGAVVFCLARASWLAMTISFCVLVIAKMTRRRSAYPLIVGRQLVLMGSLVLALVLVVDATFREVVQNRILSIFSPEHRDLNAVYRQQQLDGLWTLVRSAPWHGLGLSSSARVSSTGIIGVDGSNSVATNWVLGLLADAGVLAWPLFVVLVVIALRRVQSVGAQLFVMVAVNSLFSNLLFSPVMWLAIAFALSNDGSESAPGALVSGSRFKISEERYVAK